MLDLAYRKDLVYGGFARSETTLIGTNEFVVECFKSLTRFEGQNHENQNYEIREF